MRGLTIGAVAKQTGLPAKTIRFYEEEGVLPPPRRSDSGYRLYSDADVARLSLARRAKLLGLSLPAIKTLVEQAFAANCAAFADQLSETLSRERTAVERRIADLQALQVELEALERHVRHCCEGCSPAEMAATCGFCGLINEEGGENGGKHG